MNKRKVSLRKYNSRLVVSGMTPNTLPPTLKIALPNVPGTPGLPPPPPTKNLKSLHILAPNKYSGIRRVGRFDRRRKVMGTLRHVANVRYKNKPVSVFEIKEENGE